MTSIFQLAPKTLLGHLAVLFALVGCGQQTAGVQRIWEERYSAFPSIEQFDGSYYISFREAESHIFDKNGIAAGQTRILASKDGSQWESVALMSKEGFDLRDPKLSVTPDGRLMVIMGGSMYVGTDLVKKIPHVSFSTDGRTFTDPTPIVFDDWPGDEAEWTWRVTWHDGVGYTVTYGDHFALLKTTDGLHFQTVAELPVEPEEFPNETTVRFLPDGRMALMVRCDNGTCMGRWGVSEAPYTDWKFTPMRLRIGGPDFLVEEDGTVLAGTRSYFINGKPKTILLKGDTEGNFEEVAVLPSGGDCSYPGLRIVGDQLWVVYYSSHELKNEDGSSRAGIYLAKIPLTEIR